ncbi:hypothetical protein Tco_1366949 [Tanacetum coccineum]
MSDSEHSTVTYTSISSDYGSLDVGSLGVIVLGYDGLLMMPEDPYAYVEAVMQEPPLPDFVPEPIYSRDPNKDDEDPEEDPADYPIGRDDDKEEESSKDDTDDDDEEEHQALADSVLPPAYRTTARMSIRAQIPILFPSEAEVVRLLAISTPPSSPLTSYSSLLL